MSIVAYFREKTLETGDFDYEHYRNAFVESRRLNQQHPMWRPLWNGVSEAMFEKQEWYDFLAAHPRGAEWATKYHPEALAEPAASLEDFFS